MPFQSKRSPLKLEQKGVAFLENFSASRTEQYSKVKRARILLTYARGESISGIARKEQTDRPVVDPGKIRVLFIPKVLFSRGQVTGVSCMSCVHSCGSDV